MRFTIRGIMFLTMFDAMALTIGMLAHQLSTTRTAYGALQTEVAGDEKRLFYAATISARADKEIERKEKQRQQVIEINRDLSEEIERLKAKTTDHQAEVKRLRAHIERLTADSDALHAHTDEVGKQLTHFKERALRLAAENSELSLRLLKRLHIADAIKDDTTASEEGKAEVKPPDNHWPPDAAGAVKAKDDKE